MRPTRFARNSAVVLLAALLVAACAPRPAYRQAEIGDWDAAADPQEPEPAPPDDAAPIPDGAADLMLPAPAIDAAAADRPLAPPPLWDGGGEPAPAGRTALLIVSNPATVAADDTKIKVRLEAKGFTVTI